MDKIRQSIVHQTRVPKETKQNEGNEIMDNFLKLKNNNND